MAQTAVIAALLVALGSVTAPDLADRALAAIGVVGLAPPALALGVLGALLAVWAASALLGGPRAALVAVKEDEAEAMDVLPPGRATLDPATASPRSAGPALIQCWDPSTMEDLGTVKVDTPDDVEAALRRARSAQEQWRTSSFAQRRLLLCTIQRFIVENTATMARVACRDSGKTQVDAIFGEIAVTCEKLRWTVAHGEKWLLPEYRDSGLMNLHKTQVHKQSPSTLCVYEEYIMRDCRALAGHEWSGRRSALWERLCRGIIHATTYSIRSSQQRLPATPL